VDFQWVHGRSARGSGIADAFAPCGRPDLLCTVPAIATLLSLLHARTMYVCFMNDHEEVLVHQKMQAAPEPYLKVIAPYRAESIVRVACLCTWEEIADLCAQAWIPCVLGHGRSMQARPTIQSMPTRSPCCCVAACCPKRISMAEMRATCDLRRCRIHLVRQRAELFAPIQHTNGQHQLSEIHTSLAYSANRDGVAKRFPDRAVQKSLTVDLALIETDDRPLTDLELDLVKTAKAHDAQTCSRPPATIFGGRADPIGPRLHPWNDSAYNPNREWCGYDPEKAKALLKEGGYADGFSIELISANGR
jgi:hypothetical protein